MEVVIDLIFSIIIMDSVINNQSNSGTTCPAKKEVKEDSHCSVSLIG